MCSDVRKRAVPQRVPVARWHWAARQRLRIAVGPLSHKSFVLNVCFRLAVQCCEYEPLRLSQDRGVAVVNPGQIVIGGEVINGERQYAFDYISDIVKHTKADGR